MVLVKKQNFIIFTQSYDGEEKFIDKIQDSNVGCWHQNIYDNAREHTSTRTAQKIQQFQWPVTLLKGQALTSSKRHLLLSMVQGKWKVENGSSNELAEISCVDFYAPV